MGHVWHAYLNRRYLGIATKIIAWATKEYTTEGILSRPEASVPSTVVCPFLKPSLESDHFQIAFHPEINGADSIPIQELMIGYITIFKSMGPFHEENKKALLIVFPNIDEKDVKVLDRVHEAIKTPFVKAALMVAQFHNKCNEKSIHKPHPLTQKSDFPLMAIRHMQRHDILFLKDNAEWFSYYHRFFGDHFVHEKDKDDYYYRLYQDARKQYFQK